MQLQLRCRHQQFHTLLVQKNFHTLVKYICSSLAIACSIFIYDYIHTIIYMTIVCHFFDLITPARPIDNCVPSIFVQRLLICCHLLHPKKTKLTILDDVSGVLKPGR